jgi:hypothetical protein
MGGWQDVNRNQVAEFTLAFVATVGWPRALRSWAQAIRSRPAAASASSRRGTDAIAAPTLDQEVRQVLSTRNTDG